MLSQWRRNNPEKYCYLTLKGNAKRRGKEFTITFEYFLEVIGETDYLSLKGKTKTSLSIDRKDNNFGYVTGNLRIITLSQNSIKGTGEFDEGYTEDAGW